MRRENCPEEETITDLKKKLRHTSDDLDRCKKDKDEFIFLAAHELKAPLRKVSTFTERLVGKAGNQLDEEVLGYINRIEKNVLLMQSLIDDLSDLSEISANIQLEKCDLNTLMSDVLRELEVKKNKIKVDLSELPEVNGNGQQLKKAFKNIIGNAIKFQREGVQAEIIIRSESLDGKDKSLLNLPGENEYWKISIEDNGIGFPGEEKDEILKPFVKLNAQSSYPGNGLGLAVCDKIMKIHKGEFYAMGEEDKGSVFVLILPKFLQ